MKTIFCDIDGTLLKHHGSLSAQITNKPKILEGVLKRLDE
jgi:hydroxymethylpyrimidine pyrophosphatase-like HAD family hydrolase